MKKDIPALNELMWSDLASLHAGIIKMVRQRQKQQVYVAALTKDRKTIEFIIPLKGTPYSAMFFSHYEEDSDVAAFIENKLYSSPATNVYAAVLAL